MQFYDALSVLRAAGASASWAKTADVREAPARIYAVLSHGGEGERAKDRGAAVTVSGLCFPRSFAVRSV